MKIQVTVDMELNNLPDETARALARELVEARGLNVSRVSIIKAPETGKTFTPKAGKPGSVVFRRGEAYVIWGDSDVKGQPWATKRDKQDGLYYRLGRDFAYAAHANGHMHSAVHCEACLKKVSAA